MLDLRQTRVVLGFAIAGLIVGCGGGGTGNELDSAPEQTTISVAAADADGDTLSYQWRVTAGTIENRDAGQTILTLPQRPSLHFAYVNVSDGKGGYTEQQYAVSSVYMPDVTVRVTGNGLTFTAHRSQRRDQQRRDERSLT